MKIRNTNPMGDVYVAQIGREVAADEVVDVSDAVAADLLAQVCAVNGAANWVLADVDEPVKESAKKGASK